MLVALSTFIHGDHGCLGAGCAEKVHSASYNRGMAATPATELVAPRAAETAAERARRLYEQDGYTWAMEQARALRRRDLEAVDWDNLIEEVETLGRSERHSWESLCARAVEHLLAIEHWRRRSPESVTHWVQEVEAFRDGMAKRIRGSPGLQGSYAEMFAEAWRDGRRLAVRRMVRYEMERASSRAGRAALKAYRQKWNERLPAECPYRLEDVTAFDARRDREPRDDVWPPSVARALDAPDDRKPDLVGLAHQARERSRPAR